MSRVALIGRNSLEYISLLIEIWNSGNCAVLIDCQTPYNAAAEMMREAGVKKCYLQTSLWDANVVNEFCDIEFICFDVDNTAIFVIPDCLYNKFVPNYSKAEAVIIYSSGTTGKSKGIVLSHFAINTNADAVIKYITSSADNECIYTIRHLSHSSTLTCELLVALKSHMKMIVAASTPVPRLVFSAISKYHVTILCVNPTILSLLCDELVRRSYTISSIRKIYVSGAVLSDATYEKAKFAFAGVSIFNAYGLSEAGPRVAVQGPENCNCNSAGKPICGVKVVIVNERGMTVTDGERGVVHVKTPSLFSGYVMGKEKYVSLYQGWLNTGDIGFWDKLGELHVVGRVDDVIICDAHKIYPIDVEKMILEDPSISDCVVSQCTVNGIEMIGCLYISDKDCAIGIVRRIKDRLAQYEIPKRYLKTEAIPHNNRGKVDRKAVSEILSIEMKK